jgi:(2Fe-2S) ferredoxin
MRFNCNQVNDLPSTSWLCRRLRRSRCLGPCHFEPLVARSQHGQPKNPRSWRLTDDHEDCSWYEDNVACKNCPIVYANAGILDAPSCDEATSDTERSEDNEEYGEFDHTRPCVMLWYWAGFVLPSLGH